MMSQDEALVAEFARIWQRNRVRCLPPKTGARGAMILSFGHRLNAVIIRFSLEKKGLKKG